MVNADLRKLSVKSSDYGFNVKSTISLWSLHPVVIYTVCSLRLSSFLMYLVWVVSMVLGSKILIKGAWILIIFNRMGVCVGKLFDTVDVDRLLAACLSLLCGVGRYYWWLRLLIIFNSY